MHIIVRIVALLLPIVACAEQQATMGHDITQEIRQLDSPRQAEALGARLLEQSRAAASAATAVWLGSDAVVRSNARAVLNEMEEAAFHPLLEANSRLDPDDQAWRMTMVVETLADMRKSAATLLDRQLGNTERIVQRTILGEERDEPPQRVCDEAYVQMVRLSTADPDSETMVLKIRRFRGLPEVARDAEIRRFRHSVEWRKLLR